MGVKRSQTFVSAANLGPYLTFNFSQGVEISNSRNKLKAFKTRTNELLKKKEILREKLDESRMKLAEFK